jgi:hypothetical protein
MNGLISTLNAEQIGEVTAANREYLLAVSNMAGIRSGMEAIGSLENDVAAYLRSQSSSSLKAIAACGHCLLGPRITRARAWHTQISVANKPSLIPLHGEYVRAANRMYLQLIKNTQGIAMARKFFGMETELYDAMASLTATEIKEHSSCGVFLMTLRVTSVRQLEALAEGSQNARVYSALACQSKPASSINPLVAI